MKSVLIKDDIARVFDDSGKAVAVKEIKQVNYQVAVPAWRKMGYPIFIAVCDGLALYISPSEDNVPPTQEQMDCQARLALHHGPCNFAFCIGGASVLTWKVEKKAEPPKPTPAQVTLQAKAEARKVVNEVRREVAATRGAEPSAEEYAAFLAQMAVPPPEEEEDPALMMGVVE